MVKPISNTSIEERSEKLATDLLGIIKTSDFMIKYDFRESEAKAR